MVVQWFYERGKRFACNNTTDKWFENVRENKPHIYFQDGEWLVVQCGSHSHFAKEMCAKRNGVANTWARLQNKTEEEKDLFYKIHLRMLPQLQKECP